MRRLALAATIALAASFIGTAPAVAETTDTTTTLAEGASPSPGEDAGSGGESDDPGAEDPDDAGTDSDPGDGAESDESTPPAEDPDGRDDGEAADDGAEAPGPVDASFSLAKTKMTASEAGEGIAYTIDSLAAGDVVTASPGQSGSTTVASDGVFSGSLEGNTELKAGDTLDVSVTVAREGEESATFTGSIEIVEDDDEKAAELSVSPETSPIDDFLDNGVKMTVSNCEPGEEVTFEVHSVENPDQFYWEDTQRAAEDGTSFMTFIPGTGGDGWIGDFTASASCGNQSADAPFSVTGADDADADLSVTPKTQGLRDFLENGVNITLVNCHADDEVRFRVSTKRDPDTTVWEETQSAGEDAAGSVTFKPDGDGGAGWATEFLVMASCGDKSAETTFTVTDDDSVVDPKLSIDPTTISGENFVNRDKGVTLTVTECDPGAEVNFQVWGHEPSEKLYDQTSEANENGAASVQVYGLDNSPAAYVGTYTVNAVCMEESMDGEFVVTGDAGGSGGSDDGGDSGNAGSMPRTGAELTGLGAGALLVLGGAASIIFARRRAQTDR